jgi:hypothetical protein
MINLFIIGIFIVILLFGSYCYYQNITQLEHFQENCPAITFDTNNFYNTLSKNDTWSDNTKFNSFLLNNFNDNYKNTVCDFNATRDTLEDLTTKLNYQHYDINYNFTINLLNDFNSNPSSSYFEISINSFNDTPLFKLMYYKNKRQLNIDNAKLLILKIDNNVDPTSSDQMINLPDGLSRTINIRVSTTKKQGVYTNRLIIDLNYGTKKSYCYVLPSRFQNHFFKDVRNISVISTTNCPFTITSSLTKDIFTEYEPARIVGTKVTSRIIGADNWTGGVKVRNAVIQRGFLPGYHPVGDICDGSYWQRPVLMVKKDNKHVIPAERISFVWSNEGGKDSGDDGKVMLYKVENESKTIKEIDPATNQLVDKTYNYKALGDFSIIIPRGSRPIIQNWANNYGDNGDYGPWQRQLRIDGIITDNGNPSLQSLPVLIREDCLIPYDRANTMTWKDDGSGAWRDGASWQTTDSSNTLINEPGFPGIGTANYKGDWGGPPDYIDNRKWIIKKDFFEKSKRPDINGQDLNKTIDDLKATNLITMKTNIDNADKLGASSITQAQNQITSAIVSTSNEVGLSKNIYNANVKNNQMIEQENTNVQNYYTFLTGTTRVPGFNSQLAGIKTKIDTLKNEKNNKLTKNQIDSLSSKNIAIQEGVKPQEYIDNIKNFDDKLNIYKSMSVFQTLLPERKQFAIQY